MFRGSVDDSSHAVGEQLYFLPAQRQGGACRQRQAELCGARRRPPGAAQRLHTGRNTAAVTVEDMFKMQFKRVMRSKPA